MLIHKGLRMKPSDFFCKHWICLDYGAFFVRLDSFANKFDYPITENIKEWLRDSNEVFIDFGGEEWGLWMSAWSLVDKRNSIKDVIKFDMEEFEER